MTEEKKKRIQDLIQESGLVANTYAFVNDAPQSSNGVGLSKWIEKEIEEVDEQINGLEIKHNVKSVCKKGCCECCKQCIVVMSSECPAIETRIRRMDSETQAKLKIKTLELCKELNEVGINDRRVNSCISESMQRKLQEDYFKLNKQCIFLDNTSACIIHSVRPSLCWSYREYDTPEKCAASCFSDTGIKFDDWEKRVNERLIRARKPSGKLQILPFAIKKIMNW